MSELLPCPFPCGWQELHRIVITNAAFLARGLVEDEPITEQQRATTMYLVGLLKDICEAAIKAHKADASLPAAEDTRMVALREAADQLKGIQQRRIDRAERLGIAAEDAQGWRPITAPGQVKVGTKLRFTIGDKTYNETAKLILYPGKPDEEIIYNKRRNYYLITSMSIANKGSQKNVEFFAAPAMQDSGKGEV